VKGNILVCSDASMEVLHIQWQQLSVHMARFIAR